MLRASCKAWVIAALAVLMVFAYPHTSLAQTTGGEIGDLVWNDQDGDGVRDKGEAGIADVRVELLDCGDNRLSTTATDSNGAYRFQQLGVGRYKIRFVLSTGYEFSPTRVAAATGGTDSDADPATGVTRCLSIVDGQSRRGIDAGFVDGGGGSSPGGNWTGATGGVSVSGDRITYSGTPLGWYKNTVNSARFSSLGLADDFEVSWTLESNPTNTVWVVGLGIDETTPDRRDIEYGFRSSRGQLEVRENGVWLTDGPTLARGSVMSVSVRNGTVEYKHNGASIFTSTYAGSPDFYVDTSFKEGGVVLGVEFTSSAQGSGSATLSWAAPTKNEDGTALTDLAGYKLYWGTTPGSYPNSVTINNPGRTS